MLIASPKLVRGFGRLFIPCRPVNHLWYVVPRHNRIKSIFFQTTNKELVYRFNCRTGRQEIHVLKVGRSIQGTRRKGRNVSIFAKHLKDLLLPDCIFKGTVSFLLPLGFHVAESNISTNFIYIYFQIVFENNVDVSSAFAEIVKLYSTGRLYPEVFRFHGGNLKGSIF